VTARWWQRVTAFITLATAWRLLAPTVADPDLWGHILFGQRTMSLGLEREDPFSYLSGGHGWINHEWLSEVAFGFVYDGIGAVGLITLKLVVALLTVGLMYWHLVRRGSDALRSGLLLLPALFIMIPGFATVRPQMFTFLFFCISIIVLHQVETRSMNWIWALPVILTVWINFHGGVLAGAGMMGIWGIARVVEACFAKERREAIIALWRPVAAGVACLLALFLNPYGWGLPEFLLRTATVPRPDIVEWQSLNVMSVPGFIYLSITIFTAVTLARSPAPRRPALITLLAALVLLPLTAVRHLQLFAIGVPILLADDFAAVWQRKQVPVASGAWEKSIVTGVTLVASVILIVLGAREATCIRIAPERAIAYPVRAVEWLERSGVQGNMATYFDWGEYAIWHLYPDIRVGMDGRRETVYSEEAYQEYLAFQRGTPGWRAVVDNPETDLVLFSKIWPAYQLVDLDPGWDLLYEDVIGGVFVRAGHPITAALRATEPGDLPPTGAGMCVP